MARPETPEPPSHDVTPEPLYLRRRELIQNAGEFALTSTVIGGALWSLSDRNRIKRSPPVTMNADGGLVDPTLALTKRGTPIDAEPATPFDDVTGYNNFYELGTDKSDPAANAHLFTFRPWTVEVSGECNAPKTFDIDTLISLFPLEERIYRMRCVEAWSMVIPWAGFQLSELIQRVEPTSRAKYVAFETVMRPEELPGQRRAILDWPYTEGLRMDEAMSPLTLLAVGLYGKTLLGQNGAPLRLVVPWKYGFKGIKSIVRIVLQEKEPKTTWNLAAPREYGFYANVNPEVSHPRWSQATERRIGELTRRPTLPFNGYGADVAQFYTDMDARFLY